MSGRSGRGGRGGCGRGGGRGIVQPGSNVVDIDVFPPPPPPRPRTRSRGRDDGYMHKEVGIAPDGENGTEEPEPDARNPLLSRNGPRSPRNAARIANASIPPLTLTRHLRLLLLPLLPLLLTLIPTPSLPITVRTRARRSSK